MELVLDILSWVCIVVGGLFGLTGAVGLFRFPDFFTRMHAASITDTLCPGLIVFGLMLQGHSLMMFLKLAMVLLILAYTAPTTAHALAKAARKEQRKFDTLAKGGDQ